MKPRENPVFFVSVQNGTREDTRADYTARVLSLEYEDNEKKADSVKLRVNNDDLSNFDNPVFKTGNRIFVTWGYPGRMTPTREAIITKVTGALVLNVEAMAKSILMNKVVRSRTFRNMTRAQVVRQLARENGYAEDVDIEETNVVFDTITQARATDAQFVRRLADLEGFEFYVDFDGFHFHQRRLDQRPLRVLQYFLPPDVGDITTFDVENDVFAKPATIVTKGRDPLEKKDVTGVGAEAATQRDSLGAVPEVVGVDPVTLQVRALSPEEAAKASGEVRPTTETSAAAAKREADGVFKRTQQTAVKLNINMIGDPGIFAKSVVEARGISKRLSGLYYVNVARHKLSPGKYDLSLKTTTDKTNGHAEDLSRETGRASAATTNQRVGVTTVDGKLEPVVSIDRETLERVVTYGAQSRS